MQNAVSARKFLEAAKDTGNDILFYETFKFFENRNYSLRGSKSFLSGDVSRLVYSQIRISNQRIGPHPLGSENSSNPHNPSSFVFSSFIDFRYLLTIVMLLIVLILHTESVISCACGTASCAYDVVNCLQASSRSRRVHLDVHLCLTTNAAILVTASMVAWKYCRKQYDDEI